MTSVRNILAVFLSILSVLCHAQQSASYRKTSETRGTINVVLANANGMVVLTDSRISQVDESGRPIRVLDQPGQKLFKLDDVTVCAFAGFASTRLASFPELASASARILQDIRRELARNPTQPFHAKLRMTESLFQVHLETISAVNDHAVGDIELTVAGYDTDGKLKIGQVRLHVGIKRGSNGQYYDAQEVPWSNPSEVEVGQALVWKLAGVEDVARNVLESPKQFPQDPAVAEFAKSYGLNRGASLTVEQMENLAKSLARATADATPVVGGDNQIATFARGKLVGIEQAEFPEESPTLQFILLSAAHMTGGDKLRIGGDPDFPMPRVYVHSVLKDFPTLTLDSNFFFYTEVVNATVAYDGGLTRFDSTNSVRDCTLFLGPNAFKRPDIVGSLKSDFTWKQIIEVPHTSQSGAPGTRAKIRSRPKEQ